MSSDAGAANFPGVPYLKRHNHVNTTVAAENSRPGKLIAWGIVLTFIVCAVKIVGGFYTHSLALLSDGWHLVGDLITLLISWWGVRQSLRPATKAHTYGWYRAEILTSMLANLTLVLIGAFISWESVQHILHPVPVAGWMMLIITAVGLVIYSALTWILGMEKDNMNAKSAWLHFLGDAASSIAVLVGAVIIHYTGWYRVDGILSALIGLVIAVGAARMTWEGAHILLEASPIHIDGDQVRQEILGIQGVDSISDLHIWCLTPSQIMLSAHVAVKVETIADGEKIVYDTQMKMWEKFGIHHSTIQLETPAEV